MKWHYLLLISLPILAYPMTLPAQPQQISEFPSTKLVPFPYSNITISQSPPITLIIDSTHIEIPYPKPLHIPNFLKETSHGEQ